MATVKIDRFGGLMPRLHPSLLPDGMAVEAHNLRFKNGKIVPLRQPSYLDPSEHTLYCENGMGDIGKAKSVYCWKHTMQGGAARTDFLAFPGIVSFAKGNAPGEDNDRIFLSGETGSSFTDRRGEEFADTPCVYLFNQSDGSIQRRTVMKDAMEAPRCRFLDEVNESNAENRSFFVTWVDDIGYESPVSDPSLSYDEKSESFVDSPLKMASSGGSVLFDPLPVPSEARSVRLYMSTDDPEKLVFVREYTREEANSFVNGFHASVVPELLGEFCPLNENPPHDLRCMSYVPGSFYVGFSPSTPHTVRFSEVDFPCSWPYAYTYNIHDNIVALAVTANSVFALTDGTPYVLSGTGPGSMVASSLATTAACVSERGVCVYENAVFFASNHGLYMIGDGASSGTTCRCLTEQYFTHDQWRMLNPSSCIIGAYKGALHLFFTAPGEGRYPDDAPAFMAGRRHVGMILDMTESSMSITTHDEVANCLCVDGRTDDMYFVRNTEGV